jgi:pimeloyl-ACP methyl ester carboxylesterase
MQIIAYYLLATLFATKASATLQEHRWKDVTPSRDLVYTDCYNSKLKCARLILPLNWLDSTNNHTVIVSIVKLPAIVAEDDATFGGAIITNPGGPGEAGTEFIVDYGHRLRSVADKPGKRHYEIISFDPRGIGHSEPAANCFPDSMLDRVVSTFETRANGASYRGLDAVPYGLAMQEMYGRRCKEADSRLDGGIFEYMSTASVARDVIELVDKIAEARAKNLVNDDPSRIELRRRMAGDVNRVQYWGFSYGTVLGNVLASMFPERVGRIVLDGVVDAEDYVAGPVRVTLASCTLFCTIWADSRLGIFTQSCRYRQSS